MNNFRNVVIVTHESTTGPAHDLRDYLKPKTESLLFISHPLLFAPSSYINSSYFELYKNGVLIKKHYAIYFKGRELLLYLKDSLYTLFWIISSLKKYDIFVGLGNLNAFAGLILKFFGIVNKCVFYCIDYVPKRFNNLLVNEFYHWIDRITVGYCDATWNLSPRMEQGRREKWHKDFARQVTVPIGAWFGRIKRVSFDKVNKTEIVFMGTIVEKQGIQLILQALPKIKEKVPKIKFTIIGRGPYENNLKQIAKKLKLNKNVHFTGYIKDHRVVEKKIANAALALAVYNPDKDSFTYYADPGKVKNYLAAGVPVVITDFPYVAKQIKKSKCGMIVKYEEKDVAEQIIGLLKSPHELEKYRKNAVRFAKRYDWNKIFYRVLNNL